MKHDKIKIPDGRKIGNRTESIGSIKVDAMNGGRIFPINQDTFAGHIFQDREKTIGSALGLKRISSNEMIAHDWISWKNAGEIDIERTRYLCNTDDMIEEMLDKFKVPGEDNVHDLSSSENVMEIFGERTRYLCNTDDMMEEILEKS